MRAFTVLNNCRRTNSCPTHAEIRERMSGYICRRAASPNIVAAIRDVAKGARR